MNSNDDEFSTDCATLLMSSDAECDEKRTNFNKSYVRASKWKRIRTIYRKRASKKTRIVAVCVLFIICVAVGLILGFLLPKMLKKEGKDEFQSELGNFSKQAVSTDAAQCAQVGNDMLLKNGSAVDAAIATLLCMSVVVPQSMGLGGGFLMTIYNRENGTAHVLDAREVAPAFAFDGMFDNEKDASKYGGRSIAVPGELHGMYMAHKKFGLLSWKDLFEPAIKLSREGFPAGKHLIAAAETIKSRIKDNEGMLDLLTNKKTKDFYKSGEIMTNRQLADTYEKIANSGSADIFYKGEIGDNLVKDITAEGGNITKQDLLNYEARWLIPVEVDIDNLTLYTFPPPGSGVLLAFMLNILDGYKFKPLKTEEEEILFYHRVIEAFKFAYAKRMEFEDSQSEEIKNLVDLLKSESFAAKVRANISDKQTFDDPAYYGVTGLAREDHGTAHMSVIAPNGDAVSVTSTINLYYGSLVRSMSTGILLNDEMDDFSTNETNSFGVPPTKANRVHPGRRPMSSMAPSIFVDGNKQVRLAIGGNGGTHITSGIALVAARNLWLKKNIKEAIDEPRLHDQIFPDQTSYEKNFPEKILDGLRKLGHKMKPIVGRGSVILGIETGADGRIYANSDYRKGGKVAGL